MRVYIVAAFADGPFRGNPAGVCLLEDDDEIRDFQGIARELDQPETAFLRRRPGDAWRISWWSPEARVQLCGHATLAAAAVLWGDGFAEAGTRIRFASGADDLSAAMDAEGTIWLDFPLLAGVEATPPADVLASVDRPPTRTARHADRWLFEYARAADVRDLRVDFAALRRTGIRSLIVTAISDIPEYDIVSRNFAPIVGVDEDQVTGVAHTCLAAHWAPRLGPRLRAWQASSRGGSLTTVLMDQRVALGGRAVIELSGIWRAPA